MIQLSFIHFWTEEWQEAKYRGRWVQIEDWPSISLLFSANGNLYLLSAAELISGLYATHAETENFGHLKLSPPIPESNIVQKENSSIQYCLQFLNPILPKKENFESDINPNSWIENCPKRELLQEMFLSFPPLCANSHPSSWLNLFFSLSTISFPVLT